MNKRAGRVAIATALVALGAVSLACALAVSFDIGSAAQRQSVVASYPHLPKGAPVIWPQQRDTP